MTDEAYLAVVRKRIRMARLSRGLRQEDVAEKLGISVRSYQRYEMGRLDKRFNPYALTLRRIAVTLGEDVAEIVREPTNGELRALESPDVHRRA
ncbi:MAG: helix-turn-helix transcriptional regulator [Trueperaceae bacterium]